MKRKSEQKAAVDTGLKFVTKSILESRNPGQEEIARLAYSYWEERGGLGGSPEEDWFRAEQEIRLLKNPAKPKAKRLSRNGEF